jgi:hypothetical protein
VPWALPESCRLVNDAANSAFLGTVEQADFTIGWLVADAAFAGVNRAEVRKANPLRAPTTADLRSCALTPRTSFQSVGGSDCARPTTLTLCMARPEAPTCPQWPSKVHGSVTAHKCDDRTGVSASQSFCPDLAVLMRGCAGLAPDGQPSLPSIPRPGPAEPGGRLSCMLSWRGCVFGSRSTGRAAAPLAQSAERLHGKEKVYGSIP